MLASAPSPVIRRITFVQSGVGPGIRGRGGALPKPDKFVILKEKKLKRVSVYHLKKKGGKENIRLIDIVSPKEYKKAN